MKASDCKVGDWLVLEDKTSQSMFPVTICQVTSIDSENGIVHVTSKDGMFSVWEFCGTLMSNLNDGEPAKTLVPRSWEFNPKTKTHFVIDDYGNKFECSQQQSYVILDWWNKKNIDRLEKRMEELEKPKLKTGDVFIVTKKMLKRWKRTETNIDGLLHASVVVDGIKDGEYIATVFTIPTTYYIYMAFDDVDPYLPTGWHSYPDDAPSDVISAKNIQGLPENLYSKIARNTANRDATFRPGGVGIDFKSMESHMEGGVKVHDDVELKSVNYYGGLVFQRHKIKDRTKITLTPELNKLIGAKWDKFIGSKITVYKAYNQYSLWLRASHCTMFEANINAAKLENFLFSKPNFMNGLLTKLKKLGMSKDDKDLLALHFIDENGDPTEKGLHMMAYLAFNKKENRAELANYARQLKQDDNDKCCQCFEEED